MSENRQKDSVCLCPEPVSERAPLAASGASVWAAGKEGVGGTGLFASPFLPCDFDSKYISYLVRKLIFKLYLYKIKKYIF